MARSDSPLIRLFSAAREGLSAARDAGKAIDSRMCIACGENPALGDLGDGKLCEGCADDVAEIGSSVVEKGLRGIFADILKGKR